MRIRSIGLDGVATYRLLLDAEKVQRAEPTEEKQLAGGSDRLLKMKVAGWVPAGSQARLVKTATLNCYGTVCEALLAP